MTESRPGNALVTGASRRIGRAIALALAQAGWGVAVHYGRSAEAAAETVAEIEALGGRAQAFAAELGDAAATAALVPRVGAALGSLTCLVNNAAAFVADDLGTLTHAGWQRHVDVNLRAPLLLSQAFAARLPAGAQGNIVNLIDERVWNPTPYFLSYTVSKAGLWMLTRTLALALAPHIRVNAIGPGHTLPAPGQTEAQFARQCARVPLGRGTTPEEITHALAFILGAPAMTGQMVVLDGGQHLAWAQPGDGPPASPRP